MVSIFWMYLLSFIIGIVASFIASIFFSYSQQHRIIKRNQKRFEKLEGKYHHFKDNKKVEGNTSIISFEKPNKLKIITNSIQGHEWEGTIIMNELEPNTGEGFYEYKYSDKNVWGIISIQVSRNHEELLVQSSDKSQSAEIHVGYTMKKIKPSV